MEPYEVRRYAQSPLTRDKCRMSYAMYSIYPHTRGAGRGEGRTWALLINCRYQYLKCENGKQPQVGLWRGGSEFSDKKACGRETDDRRVCHRLVSVPALNRHAEPWNILQKKEKRLTGANFDPHVTRKEWMNASQRSFLRGPFDTETHFQTHFQVTLTSIFFFCQSVSVTCCLFRQSRSALVSRRGKSTLARKALAPPTSTASSCLLPNARPPLRCRLFFRVNCCWIICTEEPGWRVMIKREK